MRISEIQPSSDSLLCLIPSRSVIKRSPNRAETMKDYLRNLNQNQQCKNTQVKGLCVVNMSIYNLKNTYKDKRRIKDAVTVKQVKLFNKENIQTKNIPALISYSIKNSLIQPQAYEYKRKESVEKPQLKIISKKTYPYLNIVPGIRTFTSLFSPKGSYNRNALKLKKIQKQNQISQSIFETKSLIVNSKSEALINVKLKAYLSSIKEGRKLHQLPQQLSKDNKKKNLRVKIKRGNNSQLIGWLFKKRWWWIIDDEKQIKQKIRYNFIWTQLKERSFFQSQQNNQTLQNNQPSFQQFCSAHNHFPHNQYLGNKKALFYNMSNYYKSKCIDVFQKLPLTFHVASLQDKSWKKFTQKYKQSRQQGKNNIWILKPGENSNRGRGITVHESYEQIKNIIGSGESFLDQDSKPIKRTYIIQAYIDKPFLYNKRKFDIRCYMLLVNINKTVKGYWYSEGYIRTSSYEFQLNDFNSFVHLTNDAIQNQSESYGKFEQGNKISYTQFQKYLDIKHTGSGYNFQKQIVSKMKQIATDSMRAAVHIVRGQKIDKPVFEVFGLDFMVDKNFKPWLIQINTNPCIQSSCLVLEKVIPRMLDDAFKLSLDLLFPPPQNWPISRKHCLPSLQNKFQLVYSESKEDLHLLNLQQLPSLGIITEDGQVYDQKENDFFT